MDNVIVTPAGDDRVARVTVSRPKVLNALNAATITELLDAFGRLRSDAAVRAIVLTGAGERGVRRRGRYRRAGPPAAGRCARAGPARAQAVRPDCRRRQAGDRGHQRIRPGRRLRAGHGLHVARGGRHRPHGAARDQPGDTARLRRHAAAAPARRTRPGPGDAAVGRSRNGGRGPAAGSREPGGAGRQTAGGSGRAGRGPGGEAGSGGALHPRRRPLGHADVARRRLRLRGPPCSAWWPLPTTCARARAPFWKNAARSSRDSEDRARGAGRCGYRRRQPADRPRRLLLSRRHHRRAPRRRHGGARARRRQRGHGRRDPRSRARSRFRSPPGRRPRRGASMRSSASDA